MYFQPILKKPESNAHWSERTGQCAALKYEHCLHKHILEHSEIF